MQEFEWICIAMTLTTMEYDEQMRLPDGKTCADCINGPNCDAAFGACHNTFKSCVFWPSRYREINAQAHPSRINRSGI